MEKRYADIVITQKLIMGRVVKEYVWQGDIRGEVRLNINELYRQFGDKIPSKLTFGGIPLRLVDTSKRFYTNEATYVRTDAAPFWALRRLASYRLYALCNWIVPRVIMTLHIWGFAWVPFGEMPSWHHVGKRRPEDYS